MKTKHITPYECEICGARYSTADVAKKCESKPLSQDKGVNVGDEVLITSGDGKGEKATVERILVYDMEWGHYAWERYWHTIGLVANLNESPGSRQLTFDSYEPVP
jgi:hypothetical protein